MNIIGIKIDGGADVVIKNLTRGWYPMGNYDEPDIDADYSFPKLEKEIGHIYQIYPKLPEISVSCIVGRNGAGKTTMIDVMLRIINNLAYYLLDGKADDNDEYRTDRGRKLSYARGLYAKMYFETDGNLGVIDCQDEMLIYKYRSGNSRKIISYDRYSLPKIKNKSEILKCFFYTIECNYSQYGFRPSDYEPLPSDDDRNRSSEGVNGKWIEGLFHKNDGYLSPAVLTPFREDGLIDYTQEERLANRRLITLSILYYAQRKQFVPGYKPSHLTYSFDDSFIENQQKALIKSTKIFNATQMEFLMALFRTAWRKLLSKELERADQEEVRNVLSYLGYKSLKICLKYRSYQRRFALKTFSKELEKGGDVFDKYTHTISFEKRINSIVIALYKDTSHIALKIHQCISFMRDGYFTKKATHVTVDDYLKKLSRYTYDSVFKALPPAYFKVDLTMTTNNTHRGEFHFSQMSSGERQLMNSMSYVLYHIKNIQSIKPDADRVPYHHINLVFDEAELYFHPEYQRYLVRRIIDMLHWCHIDRRRIRSINIILATHSPYVLSDVFAEKSLYLKEGSFVKVKEQSFGANYYNMLKDSFFFDESPMGEIATERIQEWINNRDYGKACYVGDPIIRKYLESHNKQSHV